MTSQQDNEFQNPALEGRLDRRAVIHRTLYLDGRLKPAGLYDWQVTGSYDDTDPITGIAAAVFELADRLPGLPEDIAVERDAFSKKILNPLEKQRKELGLLLKNIGVDAGRFEAAGASIAAQAEAMVKIRDDIQALAPGILAKFNSTEAAARLDAMVAEACERPLSALENANQKLDQSTSAIHSSTASLQEANGRVLAAAELLNQKLPAMQQLADAVRRMQVRGNVKGLLIMFGLGTGAGTICTIIFLTVNHVKF